MGYWIDGKIKRAAIESAGLDWNDYADLDVQGGEDIRAAEITEIVELEITDYDFFNSDAPTSDTKFAQSFKILTLFDKLFQAGKSDKEIAEPLAEVVMDLAKLDGGQVTLKKLQLLARASEKPADALLIKNDSSATGEEIKTVVDHINRKLGLKPDDYLFFVPDPSFSLTETGRYQESKDDTEGAQPPQDLKSFWLNVAGKYEGDWSKYGWDFREPDQQVFVDNLFLRSLYSPRLQLLMHEITHAAYFNKAYRDSFFGSDALSLFSQGGWLTEGVAEWISEGGAENLLGSYSEWNYESFYNLPLSEVETLPLIDIDRQQYYRGYLGWKYVEIIFGRERAQILAQRLMNGEKFEAIIPTLTGQTMEDFYTAELRWSQKKMDEVLYYRHQLQGEEHECLRLITEYQADSRHFFGREDRSYYIDFLTDYPEHAQTLLDLVKRFPGTPWALRYADWLMNRNLGHIPEVAEAKKELEAYFISEEGYHSTKNGMEKYAEFLTNSLKMDPPYAPLAYDGRFLYMTFSPWAENKIHTAITAHDPSLVINNLRQIENEINSLINLGANPDFYEAMGLDDRLVDIKNTLTVIDSHDPSQEIAQLLDVKAGASNSERNEVIKKVRNVLYFIDDNDLLPVEAVADLYNTFIHCLMEKGISLTDYESIVHLGKTFSIRLARIMTESPDSCVPLAATLDSDPDSNLEGKHGGVAVMARMIGLHAVFSTGHDGEIARADGYAEYLSSRLSIPKVWNQYDQKDPDFDKLKAFYEQSVDAFKKDESQ